MKTKEAIKTRESIMQCADINSIVCRFHEKGKPCCNCIDTTQATEFLLNKLKPKSGNLKTGIINCDYVPILLTEFASQFKPKWVSVESGKLPGIEEKVLLLNVNERNTKSEIRFGARDRYGNWYCPDAYEDEDFIITHWMPLPPKPNK